MLYRSLNSPYIDRRLENILECVLEDVLERILKRIEASSMKASGARTAQMSDALQTAKSVVPMPARARVDSNCKDQSAEIAVALDFKRLLTQARGLHETGKTT